MLLLATVSGVLLYSCIGIHIAFTYAEQALWYELPPVIATALGWPFLLFLLYLQRAGLPQLADRFIPRSDLTHARSQDRSKEVRS